jgi:hypothetical protein
MTPSPHLHAAKRRAARRSTEDGGAVFIVAITLSVLAGLGAWALHTSALEIRNAGNERQALQTSYLSDMGVNSALEYLAIPGLFQSSLNVQANALKQNQQATQCDSAPWQQVQILGKVPTAATAKSCVSITGWQDATGAMKGEQNYQSAVGNALLQPWLGNVQQPGSLGPIPLQADYRFQITDFRQVGCGAGTDVNQRPGGGGGSSCFSVVVTAFGITQTQLSTSQANSQTTSTNVTAQFGSESLQQKKLRVVVVQ